MKRIAGWLTVGVLLVGGCTLGQLAPSEVKRCAYAAQVDAAVTTQRLASEPNMPESERAARAILCLYRIGGTPDANYSNGLLSPVVDYFRGFEK